MKGILKGIKHLHDLNIIHRDIKPENLLLRSSQKFCENDIAIADFGLSTFQDDSPFLFIKCGTPGFVAPEIANIKHVENNLALNYHQKVDMFSLGITLYYMMFGEMPYKTKAGHEIIKKNKDCNFDFDYKKMDKLPGSCKFWFSTLINLSYRVAKDLLFKLIQKDPNKRISAEAALKHDFLNHEISESLGIEDDEISLPSENLKKYNR